VKIDPAVRPGPTLDREKGKKDRTVKKAQGGKSVRTAIKVSVMTSVTSQAQQYSQRKLRLKR